MDKHDDADGGINMKTVSYLSVNCLSRVYR